MIGENYIHVGEKLRLSLFMLLFFITIAVSNLFKTSINEVDRLTLDTKIKGVGKIKSEKIIKERGLNGNYLNKEDFKERTKGFVGDKVRNRIEKTYNI